MSQKKQKKMSKFHWVIRVIDHKYSIYEIIANAISRLRKIVQKDNSLVKKNG